MAEHMQEINRKIKSITSTERVTSAMKLVSAAKLRRAKLVFEHSNQLLKDIVAAIGETFDDPADMPDTYLKGHREIRNTCYIVITASSGFCGSYNGNVIRATDAIFDSSEQKVQLVTIGSKGRDHFVRRDMEILRSFEDAPDSISYEEVRSIAEELKQRFVNEEIDEIVLVYTSFVNSLKQELKTERLLPVDPAEHLPVAGKSNQVEFVPSPEAVFDYLIQKFIELKLYNAVIEAATCEHAARRNAMDNASQSAAEMLEDLQLRYNRARQSQITDEIIEVVSGSEALK